MIAIPYSSENRFRILVDYDNLLELARRAGLMLVYCSDEMPFYRQATSEVLAAEYGKLTGYDGRLDIYKHMTMAWSVDYLAADVTGQAAAVVLPVRERFADGWLFSVSLHWSVPLRPESRRLVDVAYALREERLSTCGGSDIEAGRSQAQPAQPSEHE